MTAARMTGDERVAYLVKLALEAYDGLDETLLLVDDVTECPQRQEFRRVITERMRQAAQVWTFEVDEAKHEGRR